jgi:hypothetical protein
MSTAAAGTSALILATGGAALLIGGSIYLATRGNKSGLPQSVQGASEHIEE